jgi:hypothetical protein
MWINGGIMIIREKPINSKVDQLQGHIIYDE